VGISPVCFFSVLASISSAINSVPPNKSIYLSIYRPGKSLKRRGKSSSLHSKKKFCLGDAFFCEWCHKWRTFRPPWPTLPGPKHQPLGGSISLKFYWKLGYNPSLFILWMTCWGFGFKSCDV